MTCKEFQNLTSVGYPEVCITMGPEEATQSLTLSVEGAVSNDYTGDIFEGWVGEEDEDPIAMPAIVPVYDIINDVTIVPFVFEVGIPKKGRYAIRWTPSGGGNKKTLLTGEYKRQKSVLGTF